MRRFKGIFAADPNGFLIGLLSEEPVAAISAITYGETFGFLGCYIVSPQYRKRRYGIQIWNAGLKYLTGRNIGLDGMVDQQENYKKSGFNLAYRNVRYERIGGGDYPKRAYIYNLASMPFKAVDSYDTSFFPAERLKFIKS